MDPSLRTGDLEPPWISSTRAVPRISATRCSCSNVSPWGVVRRQRHVPSERYIAGSEPLCGHKRVSSRCVDQGRPW